MKGRVLPKVATPSQEDVMPAWPPRQKGFSSPGPQLGSPWRVKPEQLSRWKGSKGDQLYPFKGESSVTGWQKRIKRQNEGLS